MSSVISNISWKFAEKISSQAVSLVVSIVLARILDPKDYGSIAMVMIFVTLANVIVDGGFNSALIQKKNADRLDFSTVFYFSLVFSIFIYVVLYVCAPLIVSFYGPEYTILTPVLRLVGLQIIFTSVNAVQQAYVSRQMMFKKFFYSTLAGTCFSAFIGLLMAYSGYGIWALVGQYLSASIVNLITLYVITRKLPALEFSFDRLKGLLDYGIKIFATSLLVQFYLQLRSLVIGKIYSAKDLAYFDRGRQFPCLLGDNINTSVGAVLFPKMSQEQDNPKLLKDSTRKAIRYGAFVMCPMMLVFGASSEPFVRLILTEKWMSCVPLMQIFCVIYLFQPIHTANMQAIKALGKSDVYLKLEILKKVIELICLLAVMRISVHAIAINMAVLTTLFTLINAYPNKKLLDYSFREQFDDIMPSVSISLLTAGLVWLVVLLRLPDVITLFAQYVLGFIIYYVLAKLFLKKELNYIKEILFTHLRK